MKPPAQPRRRENVPLLVSDWVALDAIAKATGSYSMRGTAPGVPSWRCLLRRIARGELVVVEAGKNQLSNLDSSEPPPPLRAHSRKAFIGRPIVARD